MSGQGKDARLQEQRELLTIGRIAGSQILSTGRIHYVKEADAVDRVDFQDLVDPTRRSTDIQSAINKCRSGANDYVFLCPKSDGSAWTFAEGVSLAIDGRHIHLIGISANPLAKPEIAFSPAVTAHAVQIGGSAASGDKTIGIELANLLISASGVIAEHCIEIGVAAAAGAYVEGTWLHDLLVKNVATTAAKAEIEDFGQSLTVQRSIIGSSTAAHPDDNYLQGTGAGATGPVTFEEVDFRHYAASTGDQHGTIVAGCKGLTLRRCTFYNGNASNFAMGVAVAIADNAAGGLGGFFEDCKAFGSDVLATAAKADFAPTGMGLSVTAADVFNPALSVDGAEPVASDT